MVTLDDIRGTVSHLGLAGKAVCLHSSLRSFGWVEGGASAVVDAFLFEESTLLVPTFSWCYSVFSPFGMTATVGTSQWRSYPADRALEAATRAIKEDPQITHCEANPCERCDELIAGGPVLE